MVNTLFNDVQNKDKPKKHQRWIKTQELINRIQTEAQESDTKTARKTWNQIQVREQKILDKECEFKNTDNDRENLKKV